MSIFSELGREAEQAGLHFLIIGGHAVNALGYQRTTLDVDLLIGEAELAEWKNLLGRLGYVWGHETAAFVQFEEPAGSDQFPIDLMIVDETTFAKLGANAVTASFGEVELLIPRVLDLIALKLHALRSPAREAKGKDLPDVLALIRLSGLDISDPGLDAVLKRYATDAIHNAIRRHCGKFSGSDPGE